MERVIAEGRTLITLDEHFGDWAVLPLNKHPGVIRVKIHPPLTEKSGGSPSALLAAPQTNGVRKSPGHPRPASRTLDQDGRLNRGYAQWQAKSPGDWNVRDWFLSVTAARLVAPCRSMSQPVMPLRLKVSISGAKGDSIKKAQ